MALPTRNETRQHPQQGNSRHTLHYLSIKYARGSGIYEEIDLLRAAHASRQLLQHSVHQVLSVPTHS